MTIQKLDFPIPIFVISEQKDKSSKEKPKKFIKKNDVKSKQTTSILPENTSSLKISEVNLTKISHSKITPTKEIFDLFKHNTFNYSTKEISHILPHYEIYKKLSNSEMDYCIILEDNISFSDNFYSYLQNILLQYHPDVHDILYLGYTETNSKVKEDFFCKSLQRNPIIFKPVIKTIKDNSIGYIISKSAAIKIINYVNEYSFMFSLEKMHFQVNNLQIMTVTPHIVFKKENKLDDKDSMLDFSKIENQILQDWVKYDSLDYIGHDTEYVKSASILSLILRSNSNNCVAFNSLGYCKYHVDVHNLKKMDKISLYVRKDAINAMNHPIKDKFGRTWEFKPFYDIKGNDITFFVSERNFPEKMLDKACTMMNCVSFNTVGYYKNVKDKANMVYLDTFKKEGNGIYLLKTCNFVGGYPSNFFNSTLIREIGKCFKIGEKKQILYVGQPTLFFYLILDFLLCHQESKMQLISDTDEVDLDKLVNYADKIEFIDSENKYAKLCEILNPEDSEQILCLSIMNVVQLRETLQLIRNNMFITIKKDLYPLFDSLLKGNVQKELYVDNNFVYVFLKSNNKMLLLQQKIKNGDCITFYHDRDLSEQSRTIVDKLLQNVGNKKYVDESEVDIYFMDSSENLNKKNIKDSTFKVLIGDVKKGVEISCDLVIGSYTGDDKKFHVINYPKILSTKYDTGNIHVDSQNEDSGKKEKTKFCCFNYGKDYQHKINIFNLMNLYKKVDSIGKCCNNSNLLKRELCQNVSEYMDMLVELYSEYKFVIVVEGALNNNYITGKILSVLKAGSIPIYLGGSGILKHINLNRIIYIPHYSESELLNKIKELDSDDSKYQQMIREPWFIKPEMSISSLRDEYFKSLDIIENV